MTIKSVAADNTLDELTERELEAAVGGAASSILGFKYLPIQPKYGSVRPPLSSIIGNQERVFELITNIKEK